MNRVGWVVALALLPGAGAAQPSDSTAVAAPEPAAAVEDSPVEARCWTLLDAWRALGDDAAPVADTAPVGVADSVGEAARIESETLVAVAEELLAEGDPESAAGLLEEALALRGVAPPD